MLATMVGRWRNISKSHWVKRPKTIPKKRNLDQEINYSKPHIWSLSHCTKNEVSIKDFFSKCELRKSLRKTSFFVQTFNIEFSSRKSQGQQKLTKKFTHSIILFHWKNLTLFTHSTLNIVNNILPQHSRKSIHFTKFPTNMFLVG